MKIQNAVVLITGANRGIGLAFAQEALARGAKKVYAGARRPEQVTLEGVIPVRLDVTDSNGIETLARELSDVTLVINNAGIAEMGGPLDDGSLDSLRKHFETNVFGPLNVVKAFAPVLARNGGGAVINVISAISWLGSQYLGNYGTSKAAAWGLTNNLRRSLEAQKTQVLGLHMGFVDTDMARGMDRPKAKPEDVVRKTFQGLEAGKSEVLADRVTRRLHFGFLFGAYLKALGA